MPNLKNKYKSIKRWSEVIEIIVKNGLGFLLEKLQLGYHYLGKRMKRKVSGGGDIPVSNIAKRIRKSFEELGPSFIKLGQMLSTRPDIIPITLCEELKKLQDKVTPLPFSSLESSLIEAYGENYKEQFDYINEEALASASLAQVHRAKLKKEQIEVVLKIQKPNLESIIEGDIQIMKDFAGLMKKYELGTDVINPDLVVEEFQKNITEEINFIFEARNTERVRKSFEGDDQIIIPEVFWDYSSRKVMVTKFIDGKKLNEINFNREPGYNAETIVNRGMEAFLKMIFEDGFFHGDPHPGNIIVTPETKVALVDFGIIGRLDQRTRNLLIDVFIGIIYRDIERVVYSFEDLGVIEEGIEIKELRYDI